MSRTGVVSILNVGTGDTKVTFDKSKPADRKRAERVVSDMLGLGYAIMVKVGKSWRRATGFDPARNEYLIKDTPAQRKTAPRGRITKRVDATSARAVSIARSAGGMSVALDSVERQNLERFDNCAGARNALRQIADAADEWAGIPMPLEDSPLVIEPHYRAAAAIEQAQRAREQSNESAPDVVIRNTFYSHSRSSDIIIWEENGRTQWGLTPAVHGFSAQLRTLGASAAWGVEQEHNALMTLAELIKPHAFKQYLLTGAFLESSQRSGIVYAFRRLRPSVAMRANEKGEMRILAALCMHPIAYYSGSWAGAMCPTDDVISHLMLCRGDEPMYWRRCNQHQAHRPEAGL